MIFEDPFQSKTILWFYDSDFCAEGIFPEDDYVV